MTVWINGVFVDNADARIGFFDAGFQHGIGLFETMIARGGAVLQFEEHLERLATSARELRLFDPLKVDPLAEAVQHTLAKSGMRDARIRVTLTAGDMGRPFAGANAAGEKPAPPQPTVAIHVQPPTRYPDELFEKGVAVTIAENRANPFDPFAGHKTLMYWPRIAAVQRAAEVGCAEALWFSTTGHLAGGSVSSAFLVQGGRLRVPFARGEEPAGDAARGVRAPVLPGCTRAQVLMWAEAAGQVVERAHLTVDDVLAAEEIFLTNSSWGVMPVVRVERHEVGGGAPGPVARAMRERWLA
jgi:branched-subunit amino acid aminotransferase/4-amino-4-deoxychorismate lyase